MQRPRLIATDVDGTLLGPDEHVSNRNRAAIGKARQAGVQVALASGRPPRWIPRVAEAAGVAGYAVCGNGAVLYDIGSDTVLAVHGLAPRLLREVADALSAALPDCRFAAERVGVRAEDPAVHPFTIETRYSHPWGDDDPLTASRAEVLGHYATKLLVRDVGMTSEEMAQVASALLGDAVDVTYSTGLGLLEISAAGITKASGLAEVAQRLGIDRADVLAFGDMPNDLPMLRWAGHGVAMANAHPVLRAAADEITASNAADGVAQVLERWF